MIGVSIAIEDDGGDAGILGLLGDQFADLLGTLEVRLGLRLFRARGAERLVCTVVDHLNRNGLEGAIDSHARALGRADQVGADALLAVVPELDLLVQHKG